MGNFRRDDISFPYFKIAMQIKQGDIVWTLLTFFIVNSKYAHKNMFAINVHKCMFTININDTTSLKIISKGLYNLKT